MKTLSEEINEIKAANTSKAAKKAAIVKLGVTPYEADIILRDVECATSRARFTFGVEIECFVAPAAVRAAAAHTGMAYQYESYNHIDGQPHFKFVTDGSVQGYSDPIECVSPVLKGVNGMTALKRCCATLNEAGARVNRTCGLHVHIGAAGLTERQYANVFANYAMLEGVIDTFMAQSRRGNSSGYAKSLLGNRFYIMNSFTRSAVRTALHHDRYYKVNPESYGRHKTIEFRQHAGTTSYEKIGKWVAFCGKLVAWSKTHRLTAPVASIDDIEFLTAPEKAWFKSRAAELA